jgi:hypothetical protein
LIDEGYARWKFGDNAAALARLTEGLHSIERLPSDDTDEQAYVLRKRAGHTLMWMARAANGAPPKEFSPPPPGCCSSLNPYSGPRVRSTPHDLMWEHLVEFETAVGAGAHVLRSHEAELAKSHYGMVRMSIAVVRIRHHLKHLSLDDLVELAIGLAEALEIWRRHYHKGGLDGAEPLPADAVAPTSKELQVDVIIMVMVSGVLVMAARGVAMAPSMMKWRESAGRLGLLSLLGAWLDFAEALFVTRGVSAQTVNQSTALGWSGHLLAAVANAIDDSSSPEELLRAHLVWVNNLFPSNDKPFLPLRDIERLVISGWLRLCERPFLLRMPSRTLPELRKACTSSAVGWRKIGEILEAAADATPGTVPDTTRQSIRKMIND